MKKQPTTTREERKMKFAEAGILFVLVLGLTIFVGVRMAGHNGTDDNIEVAQVVAETPVAEFSPAEDPTPEVTIAVADSVEFTAPSGEETLAANPPRIVTYAVAEQTYFAGDYAAAADLFDAYTADHSGNAWGFFMLGLSEWKAEDLDAAEEAFIAALDLKPGHVKSLVNYGRVLLELERPAEARIQVELALHSAPENIDANRMYSRICHNEGLLDEAADGYLKVLRVQPDDVWSLNNLGLIRIEQERFAEAVAPLAKAAQLNTEVACIQNNLGVALERTGHFTAAGAAFELALAADADYAKADESLDRVSQLTEAADLPAIDLVAVAAGFSAQPVVAIVEEAAAEIMDVPGDMEVATAEIINTPGDEDPPQQ